MSPQMREDAREAPRALGIAQQDNSDLRALEVRVSELATDVRGLTRSLAHERQRTAALKIEQVPNAQSISLNACVLQAGASFTADLQLGGHLPTARDIHRRDVKKAIKTP